MINIFIPIIENVEGFCEFIAKHKEKEAHIYVGIRKSLKEKFVSINNNNNVEIHIFDDKAKKEEIINELQKIERHRGKLLVIRRPITDEEYSALTTSENEIATLRAHHNKFVTALKNFARKTIKKFFAFSFFEDISAICYSEFLHELISSCPNLSMATRINKYVGVDVGEIETQTTPVKKDYNKFKNAGLLSLAVFILGGSIAGAGCIFAFVSPIRAIFVVLVIAMLFVALTIFGILLVNYTRTITVGELEYKAAESIFLRLDSTLEGRNRTGLRCNLDKTIEKFLDAKCIEGRAEEYWRSLSGQIVIDIELGIYTFHELKVLAQFGSVDFANGLIDTRIGDIVDFHTFGSALLVGSE